MLQLYPDAGQIPPHQPQHAHLFGFSYECDDELTKKIYRAVPVLIAEGKDQGNPWGISFMAMMHMSGDSHLFLPPPILCRCLRPR
jgi:hypothetical protein